MVSPCESSNPSPTKVGVGVVQATDTDQLTRKHWVANLTNKECRKSGIGSRVHYRLLTRNAGYPLNTFAGSMELLRGTYDAFQGEKPNSLQRSH